MHLRSIESSEAQAIKAKHGHLSEALCWLDSADVSIEKLCLSEFYDMGTRGLAWLLGETDSEPDSEYVINIELYYYKSIDQINMQELECEAWIICGPDPTSRHYLGTSTPMREYRRLAPRAYKIIDTDYIDCEDLPIAYRAVKLEVADTAVSKAIMEIAEWHTTPS